MPATFQWATGGFSSDFQDFCTQVFVCFQIPDGNTGGSSLPIMGSVQQKFVAGMPTSAQSSTNPLLCNLKQFTTNSVTIPNVPGAGNTSWNVQVDPFTGALTVFQNSTTTPPVAQPCAAPNAAFNQVILFSQVIPTGTANYSTLGLAALTDNWPI